MLYTYHDTHLLRARHRRILDALRESGLPRLPGLHLQNVRKLPELLAQVLHHLVRHGVHVCELRRVALADPAVVLPRPDSWYDCARAGPCPTSRQWVRMRR